MLHGKPCELQRQEKTNVKHHPLLDPSSIVVGYWKLFSGLLYPGILCWTGYRVLLWWPENGFGARRKARNGHAFYCKALSSSYNAAMRRHRSAHGKLALDPVAPFTCRESGKCYFSIVIHILINAS